MVSLRVPGCTMNGSNRKFLRNPSFAIWAGNKVALRQPSVDLNKAVESAS